MKGFLNELFLRGKDRVQALREWWIDRTEVSRDSLRLLVALLMAGGAAGVAWRYGGPLWHEWKRGQALRQAEDFAERNDYRNAVLALRRATEATPGDPRVWDEAAKFLGRIGSPEVLVARQNQARLDPANLGLRMALVQEALRFRDTETARQGLTALEQAGRDDLAFHRLAAAVAVAMGETGELESRLERLVVADPGDAAARFNLAALRAWSEDQEKARAALVELERLGADPALRVRVALERLKLAAATRAPAKVDATVLAILRELEPAWRGREPARDTSGEPPGWDALLSALQSAAAAGVPNDAALLARWFGDLGQGARALAWIETLDSPLRSAPEVAGAAADLAARLDDLPRLRGLLSQGAWGPVPAETIDLALASRTQTKRFGTPRARSTWEDSVATARDSLPALRALTRLAGLWREAEDAERALQAIVDRFPRELWACEALRVSYATRRDIEKLWRLYQTWAPRVPDNKRVQQTWVMLGALLNRGDELQRARIEAMLSEERDRPETATVLAATAARWRAGRPEEAEAALARLPAAAADDPRAWLWRAVLASTRDDDAAATDALGRLPRERLTKEEQQVLSGALTERERRKRSDERRGKTDVGASS